MNNGPALMGASGNDMSSLEPNSGGDEDGKTRPSKSCHHVEPTPPLHKPLLVEGPADLGVVIVKRSPARRPHS
jgi:hypothetical protein